MSKRLLEVLKQDRINDLFDNLNIGPVEIVPEPETRPLGWTWECDPEGNYISCSLEIEKVLGIPVQDVLGKPITRFMVASISHAVLDQAFSQGTYPQEIDIQYIHSDGVPIQARVCILKTKYYTGHYQGFGFSGFTILISKDQAKSVTGIDPSGAKTVHHDISTSQTHQHSEKNIASHKFRFLTDLGLELRTSVNSILGYSQVILKGIDDPDTDLLSQDMRAIYDSGKQILGLTDDIIDFSKLESGSLELNLEENVNLADIITSLADSKNDFLQDNTIELILEIPANIPVVRADPIKIRKIILRLLTLTAKLTRTGRIVASVYLEPTAPTDYEAYIQVSISGMYILPVDPETLFNPFLQPSGPAQEDLSSAEISLHTSKRLVEMHGGQMGVRCESDDFCHIYFTLPYNQQHVRHSKSPLEESDQSLETNKIQINSPARNMSETMDTCPFLGKIDDQTTFILNPSRFNRCYRMQKPGTPTLDYQEQYCQSQSHNQCPVFIDSQQIDEIPTIRTSWHRPKKFRLLLILMFLFVGSILSLAGYLYIKRNFDLNTSILVGAPTQIADAGLSSPTIASPANSTVEEATPPPTPTHNNLSTPTPTALSDSATNFEFIIHRVKAGESLREYADNHNTSSYVIRKVNYNFTDPLQVDSLIIIPVNVLEIDPKMPSFEIFRVMDPYIEIQELARRLEMDAAQLCYYNGLELGDVLPFRSFLIIPR